MHPASTTHRQLTPEQREASGAGDDTLRLSIGLESVDDLIADLDERCHWHRAKMPGEGHRLLIDEFRDVEEELRIALTDEQQKLFGIEKLNLKRSELPAITHVDYSARIQTVHKDTNPGYYALLEAFNERTDCGVLVNTSFNVRGEPIVCTPEDSYRCFMRTEMDFLVVENFLLDKRQQPKWDEKENWQEEFELD